eukprot:scaffold4563_cov222-Chaetoceros_neogracile.AAC.3
MEGGLVRERVMVPQLHWIRTIEIFSSRCSGRGWYPQHAGLPYFRHNAIVSVAAVWWVWQK